LFGRSQKDRGIAIPVVDPEKAPKKRKRGFKRWKKRD